MKNNLTELFGFLIVVIPIILLISCVVYSDRKENFLSWFNKTPDPPPLDRIQLLNPNIKGANYQNEVRVNSAEYRPVLKGESVLPPSKRGTMRPGQSEESRPRDAPVPNRVDNLQCVMSSECDKGYYFTGAQFTGSNMSCHSNIHPAKAIASIQNGMINKIHVVDNGKGYTETPKISILGGNGRGAFATCVLGKNGKVESIDLKNKGYNFTSTPSIVIEKPNVNCKLCCKK